MFINNTFIVQPYMPTAPKRKHQREGSSIPKKAKKTFQDFA